MLYDEIIHALETETAIEQKLFENERISGISARKVVFEEVRFTKCQIPDNDFDSAEFVNTVFDGCDLSNCCLKNAYFKHC